MDREIKFRAKTANDSDWWYGSYVYLPDSGSHHIIPCGTYKQGTEAFTVDQVPIDPKTLCQYTGYKDVNGKEIYEGDIIMRDGDPQSIAEVWYFDCGYFGTGHYRIYGNVGWMLRIGYKIEVIGNVYDNPEL